MAGGFAFIKIYASFTQMGYFITLLKSICFFIRKRFSDVGDVTESDAVGFCFGKCQCISLSANW